MNQYEIANPKPASLIESLRAVGYDFKTAIADIIDNSIAARATEIYLQFSWNGEDSTVSITDNGTGMNASELLEAMTLGSISPIADRSVTDLGRYGLGLKTASFSQCRVLQVISQKREYHPVGRMWDLDYIADTGEWRLLEVPKNNVSEAIFNDGHGTVVTWKHLDRLTNGTSRDSQKDQDTFLRHVEETRDHIAMVFHRFLSLPGGPHIYINDRKLKPWDPFMENVPTTQLLTVESLLCNGSTVRVRPFVLPHHKNLSTEQHSAGGGVEGWNAQQGFYVYRNNRLLVAGDWLGLGFQKEEHYKLARIQLDIPNTMDSEWHIDIKKSKAMPPAVLRADLKRIAQVTRKRATEIYRHRGKITSRANPTAIAFAWKRVEIDERVVYKVNRDHPAIKTILDESLEKKNISAILRIIEESLPVAALIAESSENPMERTTPAFEEDHRKRITQLAEDMLEIMTHNGQTRHEAVALLIRIEPFDEFPEILEAMKEGQL